MQQTINIKYVPVITEKPRYVILMGGRGAGRSTFASQYALSKLTSDEYFRCAIMRYILSDVRKSIYQEILDRADDAEIREDLNINDGQMILKYGVNSISAMGFRKSSGEQKSKLKSLANFNCIIIEEADEIPEEDFTQLDDSLRTLKGDITVILLLNPPPKTHWIIRRWFDLKQSEQQDFYIPQVKSDITDTMFIHTSYLDNLANLAPHTIQNYEAYRQNKPSHYWNMIRGYVPEVVRGKIYKDWEIIDEIPKGARYLRNGLDFGYTNDPSALIAILKYNDAYVVDEMLYQKGMKNSQIGVVIAANGNMLTIGDSSEPKSIDEISEMGVPIVGAIKGAGSVNQGIQFVQGQKILVTRRSLNIIKEYENYAWLEDKDGNNLNQPKPNQQDHAMDAIRYAIAYNQADTVQTEVIVAGGVDPFYEGIG